MQHVFIQSVYTQFSEDLAGRGVFAYNTHTVAKRMAQIKHKSYPRRGSHSINLHLKAGSSRDLYTAVNHLIRAERQIQIERSRPPHFLTCFPQFYRTNASKFAGEITFFAVGEKKFREIKERRGICDRQRSYIWGEKALEEMGKRRRAVLNTIWPSYTAT
jgi:hypothetical protein